MAVFPVMTTPRTGTVFPASAMIGPPSKVLSVIERLSTTVPLPLESVNASAPQFAKVFPVNATPRSPATSTCPSGPITLP